MPWLKCINPATRRISFRVPSDGDEPDFHVDVSFNDDGVSTRNVKKAEADLIAKYLPGSVKTHTKKKQE